MEAQDYSNCVVDIHDFITEGSPAPDRPPVGARALSDRETLEEAGHRDELPEGHQSLLHASERRPHGRGDGVLAPGIGEIIGAASARSGSKYWMRPWRSAASTGSTTPGYHDLRRYGTVPHAGFGLGFERTLAYVTGLANVRDAIPFPRTPGNARY
jgi:tRNA synthetases class II (D, K and N)